MLSLNIKKNSRPIAMVGDKAILYLDLDCDEKNEYVSKQELQPLPRFDKTERNYVCGQTECGKSYYISKYLQQMNKVFPKKQIYIFSDVEHDKELDDKLKNITRFKLDDGLLDKEPIRPEVFKSGICVFDDIDSIQNKKLLKYVNTLRDALLKRGRHEDISTIVSSHLITNYNDTRVILNECNTYTIFCKAGNLYGIKYLLNKYMGLDKTQISKIVNLNSRWVSINKNFPQYVIYQHGCFML